MTHTATVVALDVALEAYSAGGSQRVAPGSADAALVGHHHVLRRERGGVDRSDRRVLAIFQCPHAMYEIHSLPHPPH